MRKIKLVALVAILVGSLLGTPLVEANVIQGKDNKLKDINNHWAEKEILEMERRNIIGGYPDGSFKPDKFVTREEAAKILSFALRIPASKNKVQSFQDVKATRWSFVPVETIKPYFYSTEGSFSFNPTGMATREEIIAAIIRALDTQVPSVKDPKVLDRTFKDAKDIPIEIKDEVIRAYEIGLIGGYEDNTLRGDSGVKRGEISALITRVFKQIGEIGVQGPKLSVSHPEGSAEELVIVTGVTHPLAQITVNKQNISIDKDGRFKVSMALNAGVNRIQVVAEDRNGRKTVYNGQIIFDNSGPYLKVSVPRFTDTDFLSIKGKTMASAKVTVNSQEVGVHPVTGEFTYTYKLKAGLNKYRIVSIGKNGKETFYEGEIEYKPPTKYQITIPQISTTSSVVISGTVPKNTIVVFNGMKLNVNPSGGFTTYMSLKSGSNSVSIRLIYPNGENEIVQGQVLYSTDLPELRVEPISAEVTEETLVVKGLLIGGGSLTINGEEVPLNEGRFEHNLTLVGGDNNIELIGSNAAGVTVSNNYLVKFLVDAEIVETLEPDQTIVQDDTLVLDETLVQDDTLVSDETLVQDDTQVTDETDTGTTEESPVSDSTDQTVSN